MKHPIAVGVLKKKPKKRGAAPSTKDADSDPTGAVLGGVAVTGAAATLGDAVDIGAVTTIATTQSAEVAATTTAVTAGAADAVASTAATAPPERAG